MNDDMHRDAFEAMVAKCYPHLANFELDDDHDYCDEALIDMRRGWLLRARYDLERAAIRNMRENGKEDTPNA